MERLKTEDLVVIGILAYGILTSKVLTTRAEVSGLSPQEQEQVKQSLEWQKPVTEPPKTEVLTPTRIALVKKPDGTYVCVYLYDTTSTLGTVVKTYGVSDSDMDKCLDDAYYQYIQDVYGVSRELVGTYSLIKTDNLYVCAKEPTTVVGTKLATGLTEEECMKRATELSGVKPQPTVTTTPSTQTAVQTISQPITTTQPAQVQIPSNYYQVLQQASQNEACFDQCRAMNSQNMSYCTQQCCTPTEWGGYACDSDCYSNCNSWVIKYHLECISRCTI